MDDKLDNFGALKQEVKVFNKEFKRKYDTLDTPKPKDVASLIEKFKAVYLEIILK